MRLIVFIESHLLVSMFLDRCLSFYVFWFSNIVLFLVGSTRVVLYTEDWAWGTNKVDKLPSNLTNFQVNKCQNSFDEKHEK